MDRFPENKVSYRIYPAFRVFRIRVICQLPKRVTLSLGFFL